MEGFKEEDAWTRKQLKDWQAEQEAEDHRRWVDGRKHGRGRSCKIGKKNKKPTSSRIFMYTSIPLTFGRTDSFG